MSLKRWLLLSLIAAMSSQIGSLTRLPAHSKAWTVEQRQTKLMQDVNSGQKSGALSAQQSKKLRKSLSNVARKKAKMKAKQNGKLSAGDNLKLQSSIDKTSRQIKVEKGQQPK